MGVLWRKLDGFWLGSFGLLCACTSLFSCLVKCFVTRCIFTTQKELCILPGFFQILLNSSCFARYFMFASLVNILYFFSAALSFGDHRSCRRFLGLEIYTLYLHEEMTARDLFQRPPGGWKNVGKMEENGGKLRKMEEKVGEENKQKTVLWKIFWFFMVFPDLFARLFK